MDKTDKPKDEYSLDNLLEQMEIPTFAEALAEASMYNLSESDDSEQHDEIAILRKKVRRLEKENVHLYEKASTAENHALLAIQQNYLLREQVKNSFAELSRREERTIEKNTLPFEGERTQPKALYFVKPKDLKDLRKESKVPKFSYAMGIEHTKWNRN